MRFLVATMLAGLVLLSKKNPPAPPISGYADANDLCGPAWPVNDVFAPVLKE